METFIRHIYTFALLCPLCFTALFHKAIMISGSDMAPWASADEDNRRRKDMLKKFSEELGCPFNGSFGEGLADCIQAKHPQEVILVGEYVSDDFGDFPFHCKKKCR